MIASAINQLEQIIKLAPNAPDLVQIIQGESESLSATLQKWVDREHAFLERLQVFSSGELRIPDSQVELVKPEQKVLLSIFAAGFTTREQATEISGQGIGLSALYQNVTQQNGSIEITSVVDQGTTFKIYLPTAGGRIFYVAKIGDAKAA